MCLGDVFISDFVYLNLTSGHSNIAFLHFVFIALLLYTLELKNNNGGDDDDEYH